MAIRNLTPWRRHTATPTRTELSTPTSWQREYNRVLDEFWGDRPFGFSLLPQLGYATSFDPVIDMRDTDNEVEVTAELPGMSESDIDITLSPDATSLTIRGEKKLEEERKGEQFYQCERAYGMFQRTLPLPCAVEADRVDAKFANGVLEIHMPKSDNGRRKVKHINVKTS